MRSNRGKAAIFIVTTVKTNGKQMIRGEERFPQQMANKSGYAGCAVLKAIIETLP